MFIGLQYRADNKMDQRLESHNYEKEETFTVKLPISLPYPIQEEGFQRTNGKFEYNGEFFNLVKHKIENDTLHIVLINNTDKSAISKSMTNFEKAINNWSHSSEKAHNLIITFTKDYTTCCATLIVGTNGYVRSNKYFTLSFPNLKRSVIPGTPPPESLI